MSTSVPLSLKDLKSLFKRPPLSSSKRPMLQVCCEETLIRIGISEGFSIPIRQQEPKFRQRHKKRSK